MFGGQSFTLCSNGCESGGEGNPLGTKARSSHFKNSQERMKCSLYSIKSKRVARSWLPSKPMGSVFSARR